MKVAAAVAVFISVTLLFAAMGPLASAASDWGQTYGGTGSDVAYAVVQTSDEGYTLAGATDSFGSGGKDFWLVKTDATGKQLWNRTYGGPLDDSASSMVLTEDGGYALAGYTTSFHNGAQEFWLIKTDSLGAEQWNQSYSGTGESQANALVQTPDGGLALAGATIVGSGPSKYSATWLVKTNSRGDILWNKTYRWVAAGYDLAATTDGGFASAGVASSSIYGVNYLQVVKTNSVGEMQWNKTYGQSQYNVDSSHASIVQTNDGGFAVAGSNILGGFLLIRTDSQGNVLWERVLVQGLAEKCNALIQVNGGGFVMVGDSTDYSNSSDLQVCFIKTDSNGNFGGLDIFGGAGLDSAYSVVQTSDGNFAIAGYTESKGEGRQDVWLIKTKPNSFNNPPPLPSASPTPVPTPYPWTTGPGSWAEAAQIQQKFYGTLGAAVIDDKVFFLGSNLNIMYDPKADAWLEKTPSPAFIYGGNAAVTSCDGKVYVAGGGITEVYDPLTDKWENRTKIPTERYGLELSVVNGKIYAIGGAKPAPYGVTAVSEANEVYEPATDSWTEMAPLPFPVTGYASAVLDGKIYVIGGYAGDPYQFALSKVQIFDPQTNQWTNGTSLQEPVTSAAAVVTSGVAAPKRIYLIGGNIMNSGWYVPFCNHMQVFDPETNNWTFGVQMPTGRSRLALVNVDDVLYALGGSNKSIGVSVPGNPTTEQWQAAWDTIASAEVHSVEKFAPFGYTTISAPSASPPPTPLGPTPTLNPPSTSSPSVLPTQSPTKPSDTVPSFTPLEGPEPAYWILYTRAGAAVIFILALGLLAFYFRKRRG